jgi:hypothetical protein
MKLCRHPPKLVQNYGIGGGLGRVKRGFTDLKVDGVQLINPTDILIKSNLKTYLKQAKMKSLVLSRFFMLKSFEDE